MDSKRNRKVGIALLLLLPLAAAGCASQRPVGQTLDDAGITAKVKAKLSADPEINPFEIDVDTRQGVVSLRGTVEDEQDRRHAAELARNTEGVVRVDNQIELGDPTVAENADDAVITAKIKSKLAADPEINPFNIDVDSVRGGVVTLSGTVAKQEAKDQAEQHARNTTGVREVNNEIVVREERTAEMRDGRDDMDPDDTDRDEMER